MEKTAFVTGGSGFIGGRLVKRLVSNGWTVRALARSDSSAAAVEALGAQAVRGDLDDSASLEAGAAGCDVAFHLAAHLGDWGPMEDFIRGNVVGTRNTLVACEAAGVKRFVHCGTEAALMAGDPLIDVDETTRLRPDSKAPYPATKAQAEIAVRESNHEGFATMVLRPRFVWGAGDTTLLPTMMEMVEAGKFAWVGGGHNITDTTHVENVVEGLVLTAERGRGGEAYFVTDDHPTEFREIVTAMLATQGVEAPDKNLPGWLLSPLATLSETAWKLLPLPGAPSMSYFTSWILTQQCTINIAKAKRDLGYVPVVSREEGLAEMRAAA